VAHPRAGDLQQATRPGLPSSPRSSSPWPAAIRCRATAFSSSTSASSCAAPMCSISRDPRCEEYTICTARAPEAVFTVRTCGTATGNHRLVQTQHSKNPRSQPCSQARHAAVMRVGTAALPGIPRRRAGRQSALQQTADRHVRVAARNGKRHDQERQSKGLPAVHDWRLARVEPHSRTATGPSREPAAALVTESDSERLSGHAACRIFARRVLTICGGSSAQIISSVFAIRMPGSSYATAQSGHDRHGDPGTSGAAESPGQQTRRA